MGLDTTHDCWHGAYSAFHRWRCELAKIAGYPPLDLMEGFYNPLGKGHLPTLYSGSNENSHSLEQLDAGLPVKWECLKPSPLHEFLYHSDCDGEIAWENCNVIANCLEELLPKLPSGEAGGHIGNWRDKTKKFIDGLRLAFKEKENVEFH